MEIDYAGVTQAEVAERIGTTLSAVARLESVMGKHSPSLATLQKYAHALGCRLELRLVTESQKKVEPVAQLGPPENRWPVSSDTVGERMTS